MPAPTTSKEHGANYFISWATLHKLTSCFSSATSEERRQCKPEMLIAHTAPTEILSSCCDHQQGSHQLLHGQVGGHGVLPKTVSVKQRRNHWFLDTVCSNPARCATQQVVQALGWHTHLTPGEGSSADLHSSTSTSHSSSSLLCTHTHLWLSVKHHSPHSNKVI